MMGCMLPETCSASYKHGIINFDTLLDLVGYFCMNYTMMHGSTNIKILHKVMNFRDSESMNERRICEVYGFVSVHEVLLGYDAVLLGDF